MNAATSTYNYLENFLDEIRSMGRYVVSLDEIKKMFHLSDKAVNQALYRLKTKNRIAQIRHGFYAIISPEYSKQKMIPPPLFIDDMMLALGKKYYVGLISAAALHGAAHQQPMQYFVVTEKPALRAINTEKLRIKFFVKKGWGEENILQMKTDAGKINVSSPELTALDLLYYLKNTGLNNTYSILRELVTEMKVSQLSRVAKNYGQTAAIQRLGYLLDCELHNDNLAAPLYRALNERKHFPVQLSLGKHKDGELNTKWKIVVNDKPDGDL